MGLRGVTFDVYYALFDTVTGLGRVLAELFRRRNFTEDPRATARAWRQKQMEYFLVANSLEREGASNRKAVELSAQYALRRLVPSPTPDELRTLTGAWERLPAWPEADEVLKEVRKRPLMLGAVSNGDEGMLRTLLGTLAVPFDHIISTEGGRFKPHPSIYRKALDVLGIQAEELLHVSGSPQDAMGATAAGIRTLWVNRVGDAVLDPALAPAFEVADLRGVVHLLDKL